MRTRNPLLILATAGVLSGALAAACTRAPGAEPSATVARPQARVHVDPEAHAAYVEAARIESEIAAAWRARQASAEARAEAAERADLAVTLRESGKLRETRIAAADQE